MDKKNSSLTPDNPSTRLIGMDALCRNSIELILYTRKIAARQINLIQLMTYYALGRWIVEEQQAGEHRAGYGKKVIETLSNRLNAEFGKGFSADTLENARKFYLCYQNRISEAVFRKFTEEKSEAEFRISDEPAPFTLSWSHYLQLMRIKNPDERRFYEIEATKSAWFEARQKRFTYDEENFYVDLVFYNRLLRCYVLIDLKIDKLTHQDLGQMQMYVNYYDRYQKLPEENPTIGILLCKEKNDAVVQMTLPENSNIFASEYSIYLPDKKLLQKNCRNGSRKRQETKANKDAFPCPSAFYAISPAGGRIDGQACLHKYADILRATGSHAVSCRGRRPIAFHERPFAVMPSGSQQAYSPPRSQRP